VAPDPGVGWFVNAAALPAIYPSKLFSVHPGDNLSVFSSSGFLNVSLLDKQSRGRLDCEHQVESLPSERLLPETDDPTSLLFDHWITAAEVGQRYGIAPADVARVSDWLDPQGFKVNSVYPSQMVIDFPGLAGSSAMRPIRLRPGPSRKPASYIAGSQRRKNRVHQEKCLA